MNALTPLAHQPVLALHLLSSLAALLIGAVLMIGRKGHLPHRVLGWVWVGVMSLAALSSIGLGGQGSIPHIAGFSPIHGLTLAVLVFLPTAIVFVRRGNVRGHALTMRWLFYSGCVVAGAFTLLPGRLLGGLVWG
jgi:uncharacterized membrane protein